MSYTTTTNYNLKKIDHNTEENLWGQHLNDNFDIIDANLRLQSYETPWINRSEWRNVHLGTNETKNLDSNIEHNLNTPLYDLLVKILVNSSATDNNSFEVPLCAAISTTSTAWGLTCIQMSLNLLKIQTGEYGILYIQDDGSYDSLYDADWFYKVKIHRLT